MILTDAQRDGLLRDGYAVLPGAVPADRVADALRAVNHSLGRGLRPEDVETFRARSFCPELQTAPLITDLLYGSQAWPAAESLLGAGDVERTRTGQIALVFPGAGAPAPLPPPHIDGMYTPQNGVPKGSVLSFTLLAGVMLSDVPHADMGNLVVWPGTHRLHEQWFREQGPRALLEGMPKIALPAPVPVTGRAGDVVLCHYQLAHATSRNTSPHIRYAVYFRLKHRAHERHKWESLTDLWREWPGLREAEVSGR
jgi:hypothetical protein